MATGELELTRLTRWGRISFSVKSPGLKNMDETGCGSSCITTGFMAIWFGSCDMISMGGSECGQVAVAQPSHDGATLGAALAGVGASASWAQSPSAPPQPLPQPTPAQCCYLHLRSYHFNNFDGCRLPSSRTCGTVQLHRRAPCRSGPTSISSCTHLARRMLFQSRTCIGIGRDRGILDIFTGQAHMFF